MKKQKKVDWDAPVPPETRSISNGPSREFILKFLALIAIVFLFGIIIFSMMQIHHKEREVSNRFKSHDARIFSAWCKLTGNKEKLDFYEFRALYRDGHIKINIQLDK